MNPADPSVIQTANVLLQYGFMGMLWFGLFVLAYIVVFKVVPYKINVEWPRNQTLKEKRIEAEIIKQAGELKETQLLRETLQDVGASVKQIAILIDQHDRRAATGINDILALVRILLDKSGVDQATVENMLTKDDHRSFEALLRKVLDSSKLPNAQLSSEMARS